VIVTDGGESEPFLARRPGTGRCWRAGAVGSQLVMPTLRVEPPEGRPFEVEIRGAVLTIGRGTQNDVTIPALSLSRTHARIGRVAAPGRGFEIEDLGSRNGTFVNGKQVRSAVALHDGDEIRVGDVGIRFRADAQSRVEMTTSHSFDSGAGETYVIGKEHLNFQRFAEESGSGAVSLAAGADLWPVLNQAAATLIANYPVDQLCEVVMDIVFRAVRAECGALLLAAADGGRLEPRVVRQPEGQSALQISSTIVQTVVEGQQALLTLDAQVDERLGQAASVQIQGIRSVLAVPLWNGSKVIGLIYVDSRLAHRAFTQHDLRLLGLIANMAAVKLENSRLLEEQLEKERMDEQLALAARIQRRLLPQGDPQVPRYEVCGQSTPSYEIGGDYYDFIWRGERRLLLVVADVSGKGVGAALLMAAFQASLRTLAPTEIELAEMMARLNRVMCGNSPPEKFVTAFLAELDLDRDLLRYVNAGHNPPVALLGGELCQLARGGPVIGLLPNAVYRAGETTFGCGDLLALYTDGISEREGPGDEEYGEQRLGRFFQERREAPLSGLMRDLDLDLRSFSEGMPARDDSTVVLLRRLREAAG
jgi:phosphoserine phosphatase RsbU/P